MQCAILGSNETYVNAHRRGAEARIAALKQKGIPLTLILREPASMDLVRAAGYSADNTLHVFVRAQDGEWAAPYLAAAGRCGIRSAATIYPIVPGVVRCADVLETVASIAVNYRMTFLFMFPALRGLPADERFCERRGDCLIPTGAYVRSFMEKVHKYVACTACRCGVCGKNCALCTEPAERPLPKRDREE